LSRCQSLYNGALEHCKTWWQRGQGQRATDSQQQAEWPDLKAVCPAYAEVNAHVLQDVIWRVEHTYQAFFPCIQAGETPGYPRFQRRGRYTSFTDPQYGRGAVLDGGVLSLSKIGHIPLRLHRRLEGTPKTVPISREADGWYACVSCAEVPVHPVPLAGRETGLDVGLKVFLIPADGEGVENPRHYRKAETPLQKAQRRLSRKKKGSKRRTKARPLLARKHQKVRRQRQDFHHKVARYLVRHYDLIAREDLRVAKLVRNHPLAKSISDAGWSSFRPTLEDKAACAGTHVIVVAPHYTSQDCSSCGKRVENSLSVRTHVCPFCGFIADRDHNAAMNMLRAGQTLRGAVGQPAVLKRESVGL